MGYNGKNVVYATFHQLFILSQDILEEGRHRMTSNEVHGAKEVVIDLVAGSLGATASVYVGQPMDTLKVKMQTFPHLYPTLGKCLRDTWNKDGLVRGLYAGTSPSLIANIAENSILFAANSICQKFVAKISGKPVENL